MRKAIFAALVSVTTLQAMLPPSAHAAIYSYTDKAGEIHFVDSEAKIPPEYRKKTRTIEMPARPAPPAQGEESPAEPAPDAEAADPPAETPDETARPPDRDNNGHGEQWWRRRKEKLDNKKRGIEAELAELDDAPAIAVHGFYTRQALYEREQKKERLKKTLTAVNQEIAGLREEARQAGAPPGWLR